MASQMAVSAQQSAAEEGRRSAFRPVDLVHLSRYTLGERALEREILELFCVQAGICRQRLRAAASDKEWMDAAHSLKGSANAIGAWSVGALAERAETLTGEALLQGRDLQLAEIEAALREAESYIAALLADR